MNWRMISAIRMTILQGLGIPQCQDLYQQLAEEKRRRHFCGLIQFAWINHGSSECHMKFTLFGRQTNEWWEWHTARHGQGWTLPNWNSQVQMSSSSCQQNDSRLPQYHEDFMQLRQMEAALLQQKMAPVDLRPDFTIQPGAMRLGPVRCIKRCRSVKSSWLRTARRRWGCFGA